jgi:hypothetical protein
MRSYLEIAGRGSVLTGVTANASLESPEAAPFIAWRALFAAFPVEAIRGGPDLTDRAEFLASVHRWAVEPDGIQLDLDGPDSLDAGKSASFQVTARLPEGVRIAGWRWDPGDRRGTRAGAATVELVWPAPGLYTLRVEALTAGGHTYVTSRQVEVGGLLSIHLPLVQRAATLP